MEIKLIIKALQRNRAHKVYEKINRLYHTHIVNGDIKKFDDDFYSQFDGMFFDGIPIYYYLQKMNMGRCFDASAVLPRSLAAASAPALTACQN